MTASPAPTQRSGLAVLADVIIAPSAAFEELREHTHWGWAFVVTCVLGMIGAFLQAPASEHATLALIAHDPKMADLTAAQRESATNLTVGIQHWVWLAYPFIAAIGLIFATLIFTIANVIGKGVSNFGRLFGFAANVAIVNFGISYLLLGVLTRLRGAEAFNSTRDIVMAIPSLAWLVPVDNPKLQVLLAGVNPFQLWSLALIGLGLQAVARVPAGVAWGTAVVTALGGSLFGALFAR